MTSSLSTAETIPSGPTQGLAARSYGDSARTGSSVAMQALLLLTLSVGSGGYVTPALAQSQTRSSSPGVEWAIRAAEADTHISTISPSEQVLLIRRWLSLNVADTARVLQVQRPTIYAWTSGRAFPSQEHLQRITILYELASLWRERSDEPIGQRIRQPVISNRTLFDLLSDATIERSQVVSAMRLLAEPHATHRPQSAAEIAAARGFRPRSEQQQRRALDRETRVRRASR